MSQKDMGVMLDRWEVATGPVKPADKNTLQSH